MARTIRDIRMYYASLQGLQSRGRPTPRPKPPTNFADAFSNNKVPDVYQVAEVSAILPPEVKHYVQTTGHVRVAMKRKGSSKVFVVDPLQDGWDAEDYSVLWAFLKKKCLLVDAFSDVRDVHEGLRECLMRLVCCAPTL